MDSQNLQTRLPIQFKGQAGEYFGIWIVNICLTLITLGLYSPWAKIRRKRYFYGSTQLAGASFDYVASPWAILKGRLIAVAVVVVGFSVAARFAPWVNHIFSLAFVIALPWLIVRTRRFNAVNTVYRNLRFGFNASTGAAARSFLLAPMLLGFSLGLAQPWVKRQQMKLVVDHSCYGNTSFQLEASLGDFWAIFKRYLLVLLLGIIPLGVAFALLFPHTAQGTTDNAAANRLLLTLLPPLVLWIMVLSVYLDVLTSNLVYSKTRLGDIPMHCAMRFWPLLGLHVSNALGIALSFGLLIPWAKIRMARYRLGCLGLLCTEEALQGFAAGEAQNVAALGEELSDILDVDIGL